MESPGALEALGVSRVAWNPEDSRMPEAQCWICRQLGRSESVHWMHLERRVVQKETERECMSHSMDIALEASDGDVSV